MEHPGRGPHPRYQARRNSVTRCTTACFEPSLDYVVAKALSNWSLLITWWSEKGDTEKKDHVDNKKYSFPYTNLGWLVEFLVWYGVKCLSHVVQFVSCFHALSKCLLSEDATAWTTGRGDAWSTLYDMQFPLKWWKTGVTLHWISVFPRISQELCCHMFTHFTCLMWNCKGFGPETGVDDHKIS